MSNVVIWAERYDQMKLFYSELFSVSLTTQLTDFVTITDGLNVVQLHKVPEEYLSNISNNPELRAELPIKPVFTLKGISDSSLFEPSAVIKSFALDGFLHSDIADPDGNVICVRHPTSD